MHDCTLRVLRWLHSSIRMTFLLRLHAPWLPQNTLAASITSRDRCRDALARSIRSIHGDVKQHYPIMPLLLVLVDTVGLSRLKLHYRHHVSVYKRRGTSRKPPTVSRCLRKRSIDRPNTIWANGQYQCTLLKHKYITFYSEPLSVYGILQYNKHALDYFIYVLQYVSKYE